MDAIRDNDMITDDTAANAEMIAEQMEQGLGDIVSEVVEDIGGIAEDEQPDVKGAEAADVNADAADTPEVGRDVKLMEPELEGTIFEDFKILDDTGKDTPPEGIDAKPDVDEHPTDVKEGVTDIREVEQWLGDINPKYDPYDSDPSYENNCGCCAYAVSRRLDGAEGIGAGPDNIGTDEGMAAITGHEIVDTTRDEIELTLLEQGEGAHCIVGINRMFGPGHWFNAFCDGNKVYYVDGQCNQISEWPPKDLGWVSSWVMEKKGEQI